MSGRRLEERGGGAGTVQPHQRSRRLGERLSGWPPPTLHMQQSKSIGKIGSDAGQRVFFYDVQSNLNQCSFFLNFLEMA